MAPNLAVKSDSWLDLSINAPVPIKRSKELAQFTSSPTNHRHSIISFYPNLTATNCESNTLNSDASFCTNQNNLPYHTKCHNNNKEQLSRRNSYCTATANYADKQLASKKGRPPTNEADPNYQINKRSNGNSCSAHLLIRMRQQNYLSNKSSTTTLSSDLSNSIDLIDVAQEQSLSNRTDNEQKGQLLLRQNFIQKQEPVIRAHESRRITQMKERLSRRGVGGPTKAATGSERQASPLVRSLSSFSERLSGKLTHFRHSWKQFLYNHYNHQESKSPELLEPLPLDESTRWRHNELHTISVCCGGPVPFDSTNCNGGHRISAGSEVERSRRQMTDEWIERHHSKRETSRRKLLETPRSLEVSNLLLEQTKKSPLVNQKDGGEPQNEPQNKSYSCILEANKGKLLSYSSTTSPSSTITLVSQPPISLESMSSASTINSITSLHMSKPANNHKQQRTTSSRSPPRVESELDEERLVGVVLGPTSDYWSTVNSSDYYKQALQMQQVGPTGSGAVVAAQPVGFVGNTATNNQLMLRLNSPILLSDQEYYLDVANAAGQLEAAENQAQNELLHHQFVQSKVHQLDQQQLLLQQQQLRHQQPIHHQHIQLHHPLNVQHHQHLAPGVVVVQDEDYDDYAVPSDENCRLDRSQVELVQMIGEGQKGYVFLGKLQSKDGRTISDVAIKTLKYETDELIEKLMREAAMMRQFEHPHIIKFIGVCPETPALIAMELAEFGEIKHYLKLNKHLICVSQLVLFTFQISTALSYLESKQYVHRDVAARNVLVCSHNCVKLADFGLSRNLQIQQPPPSQQQTTTTTDLFLPNNRWRAQMDHQADKSQYVAASRGKLPVRWLAPESLAFRRFTSASDVWMFAVCSWEFFQFGQLRPWAQIHNNQVLLAIESGQRLARPEKCPTRLYQLMLQCWSYAPIQRPKFRELKQSLWSIYLNERAKEQLELEQQQQLQQLQIQQQLQMQLQLKQQHIQPQRVIDTGRLQQEQPETRLANMMLRNKNRLQSAGFQWGDNHRPLSDIKTMSTPEQSKQVNSNLLEATKTRSANHFDRLSASPLMATNYSSNMSGYSSATATTAEHSVNSSRSSSMGSLARQQAAAARALSERQAALKSSLEATSGHSPTKTNDKLLSSAERAKKIDQNIRRFQRAPGHILQKQRSQGSIVTPSPACDWNLKRPSNGSTPKYGYDDQALGCLSRRHRRPMSELQLSESMNGAEADYDEDDEGDENADSSDPETTRSPLHTAHKGLDRMVAGFGRLGFDPPALGTGVVESTYDGIMPAGEVAMLRGASTPVVAICRQQPTTRSPEQNLRKTAKLVRPDEQAAAEEEAKRVHEQKLANIIEALKIAPMKAKLTYKSDGSRRSGPDEQHALAAGSSAASLSDAAKEEQRQLALHRRLLGHIRPTSQKNLNRKSTQLEQTAQTTTQQSGSPKEIVDQSLQILESLISEKPRFVHQTIHDKQVRAAQASVAQIAEFQLNSRPAVKRNQQRPKSVHQAKTSSSPSYFTRSP